jgi:hypothetical protein
MNAEGMARLNASPETVRQMQKWLGMPESGVMDPETAAAIENFQVSKGWGADFGMTGNADEWNQLTAGLSQAASGAPNVAMEDPAYAAFVRMSGVQTSNIKNEIQARITAANSERNRAAAGYDKKADDTQREVGLDYEDRGFYNSGFRSSMQASKVGDVRYNQNLEEAARTDAMESANRHATQDLAELGQKRAEEEIAARSRINEKRAKQTYNPAATVGN